MSKESTRECKAERCQCGCVGTQTLDEMAVEAVRVKREVALVTISERPFYAFTIGMRELYNKPELIFSLETNPIQNGMILSLVAEAVGKQNIDISKPAVVRDVLTMRNPAKKTAADPDTAPMPAVVVPIVDNRGRVRDMMGTATRFYGDSNFDVAQVFITDKNARFPWQPGCESSFVKATLNFCDPKELHEAARLQ